MADVSANSYDGSAGTVLQVGTLNGTVELGQRARTVRIVPTVTSVYRDRVPEFGTLSAWAEQALDGGSQIVNIVGAAGVGKTTLALTWINAHRERFGHAQIAMECGGTRGQGRSIEEVCDSFFVLKKVSHGATTVAAKVDLMRSLIEGEPVALLLDDVRSAAQVLPFLSNLPGVLVFVTSRTPVPGLAQYRPRRLVLDPLPSDAVRELFEDIVGVERTSAEPEALDRLVETCAGLPLLASHAAGLLHDDEELRLADLADRMAEQGRLAALEAAYQDVARPSAVFEVVYREFSPAAARMYRALGLHPVRDFDDGLVAALVFDEPDGTAGFDQLVRRGVVRKDRRGRYVMDDLTHEHAGLAAARELDPDARRSVRGRVGEYYLRAAVAGDTARRWKLGPLYAEEAPFPLPEAIRNRDSDRRGVLSWFAENMPAIIACAEQAGRVWEGAVPGYGWQIAEATNAYFTAVGHNDERTTLLGLAERDADACADPDALARVQAQWGETLLGQGKLDEAAERFQRSLRAAEAGTETRGRAAALEWLGITERRRGNAGAALDYFDRALPHLDPNRPRSRALLHLHRADAQAVLGDVEAALESYRASAEVFRHLAAHGERDTANEGKVLVGQAELLTSTDPDQARALYEQALPLFTADARPYQEAKTWEALGDLNSDPTAWRKALTLYEDLALPDAAHRVRQKLP
ncbi:tetratricopeptide repeat protein [Actinocorallia sp. API 0066]|uniref:tetratricopeptide repeat protein n=1 Tax=Actinocorallia sp. API 0066 TaxID=2896846 RepID=UPI001E3B1D17|nr:tetratricopeptide repeat protein [Actinocorallia sp. API 0066]MCD0453033.1 tetratricopeptide repeat protein [Actinocorallia sp. API 0066]